MDSTRPKDLALKEKNNYVELDARMHPIVGEDLCHSDMPEWLQEFRENLVDDRVPEHRASQGSFSHGSSLEPLPARNADLGEKSV